ncbi:STAS domain-containing protein [Pseudonocardia sp.]|uniref:STAS domain-containing protein n=1 Tax=Pseudonocardia sp. TaxID=60912 RepID=UPI0031FD147D
MSEERCQGSTDTCTLTTSDRGDVVVVQLRGALDYTVVASVRDDLESALRRLRDRALVLDLAEVDFLDSTGISALIDTARTAGKVSENSEPLRLVVDHARAVTRPIEVAGLDGFFMLYDTLSDALAP